MVTDRALRERFSEAGPAHVESGFTPRQLAAGNRRAYELLLAADVAGSDSA